jgi:hypothetical protein
MTTAPIVLLYLAAGALGAYMLLLWFRQARRLELIGFHLILGAAALETMFAFLRNSDLDVNGRAHGFGTAAIAFMSLALLSGFCAPLLRKQPKEVSNALLATHVCSGVAGFLVVLAFVSAL